MRCSWCGELFKTALEREMAPTGPDGNPIHYACRAEWQVITADEEETDSRTRPAQDQ